MSRSKLVLPLVLLGVSLLGSAVAAPAQTPQPADLIFHGGKVWTVDAARPTAQAVAVRGNLIARVGSNRDVLALRGPSTEVVDLRGRLLLPGFIDGHTHFENAADWFYEVMVTSARDVSVVYDELRAAVQRVPEGMWITSGTFGTFGSAPDLFAPDLRVMDQIAPNHPVLLHRYDGRGFANSKAFELIRVNRSSANPGGGEYVRDPVTGELTGELRGNALHRVEQGMPPRTRASKLIGARAVQREFLRHGITTIHDIARVDELTQRAIFHTNVERSASNLGIFTDLHSRGELAVRLRPILGLDTWRGLPALGITPGSGDDILRYYGGLKAFVDGYLMFEGRVDQPENRGDFTFRFVNEDSISNRIVAASAAGYRPAVHVVGDRAIHLLINWYERAIRENRLTDPRFRIIHMFYPTQADIERAGRLRLSADVTPDHFLRDYRTIEGEIGPERARTAHGYKSMLRAGIRLNIVTDWPGSFWKNQGVAPISPLENIYLVVTRQDTEGRPAGGWHPEERLTVEEAIRAMTLSPAETTFEEDRLGSIAEGKLADLVVLSKDILSIAPRELLTTEVDFTVMDGRIVHRR
jgi:predicted amidohydrolase YtcJ